jgi:hypothetical protein
MIAKFDTAVGGTKKGSSTLLWVAVLAIGGYLVYQYVIKPKQAEEQTQ